MRLRTACELELIDGEASIHARRPTGLTLPTAKDLTEQVTDLLSKCRSQFAEPTVTELTWKN